jgi:hypothetical protein
MKKPLLTFVLGFLITQSAFSQFYENEKELYGLKGSVKTIVIEEAEIVLEAGKYVEKNRKKWKTETYDLKGNLIKEDPIPPTEARPLVCVNGKCNTEEPQRKYRYNEQGKIIEELSVLMDGTITSKREFDYDSRGKLLEWRFYYQDETDKLYLAGKWVYTRNGNESKSIYYEGCCTIKRWQIAIFDKYKNLIEFSHYRADGSMTSKSAYAYEYEAKGNWTKRIMSVWVTKDGKSFFEPVEAQYRTFIYYDDFQSNLTSKINGIIYSVFVGGLRNNKKITDN